MIESPKVFWSNLKNQKNFFDSLAQHLNIQNPKEWYRVTLDSVRSKGGETIMELYDNSLIKALQTVNPGKE